METLPQGLHEARTGLHNERMLVTCLLKLLVSNADIRNMDNTCRRKGLFLVLTAFECRKSKFTDCSGVETILNLQLSGRQWLALKETYVPQFVTVPQDL
jgi:hypothetical protein